MARKIYIGDNSGMARKVKSLYIGDNNGIARRIKKAYVGVGGLAFLCYNNVKWLGHLGRTWNDSVGGLPGESDFYVNCLLCANGICMAASTHGIYYSTDGKTWKHSNGSGSDSFLTVSYGNGFWVACGNGIRYMKDIEQIGWMATKITTGSWRTSCYGNGIWVVSSDGGKGLYYSTNVYTWTQSNITDGRFGHVVYADGTFVASSYGSSCGIFYSKDGITWAQSNITDGEVYSLYHGGDIWLAGSETGTYYSKDGITWGTSSLGIGDVACGFYYGNGIWVAASIGGCLYYSTDGITWSSSNIDDGSITFVPVDCQTTNIVIYHNESWVAGSSIGMFWSQDGKTWTHSDDTAYLVNTVVHDGEKWIAGGEKGIIYSTS